MPSIIEVTCPLKTPARIGDLTSVDKEALKGSSKKRAELADLRADAAFAMKQFAMSERRACKPSEPRVPFFSPLVALATAIHVLFFLADPKR